MYFLFQKQLFQYFYLEPEGMVRREALGLLKVIFERHKMPRIFEENVFDCLSYAVLEDDYKFVKMEALSFWDRVIEKELENEGMIDGTFPAVTFSKLFKKIITFDDATVAKCLLRVLHRLNEIGGLNVFLYVFENENDDELINLAIKHITKIADMLKKYDTMSYHSDYSFSPPSSNISREEVLPKEFISSHLELETNNNSKYNAQSSSSSCEETLPEEFISEFEKNRYPKNNTNFSRRNNHIALLDFLRVFDNLCKKRTKKASENDDLETILDKIFAN